MIYILITIFAVYVGIVGFMYINQRKLLYFPDKQIGSPEQYGLHGFDEQFLKTSDGLQIQSWYRPAKAEFPTIIYFHGNASHMGNRAGIYSALAAKGYGVLAVSYRGYGKSEGSPTEQGLYIDARTAISYLLDTQKLYIGQIMIYGESLGTGVGVQMASEYKVAALILQAPYMAVSKRAAEIYPYLPVQFILHDHYDSLSKIAQVRSPLLILHGELDTTIPMRHGKMLFAKAGKPKEAVYYPDVGHNNFDSAVIAYDVLQFTNKNGVTRVTPF